MLGETWGWAAGAACPGWGVLGLGPTHPPLPHGHGVGAAAIAPLLCTAGCCNQPELLPGEPQPGNALGTSGRGGSLFKTCLGPGHGCKLSGEWAAPAPTVSAAKRGDRRTKRDPQTGPGKAPSPGWENRCLLPWGERSTGIRAGTCGRRLGGNPLSPSAAPRARGWGGGDGEIGRGGL